MSRRSSTFLRVCVCGHGKGKIVGVMYYFCLYVTFLQKKRYNSIFERNLITIIIKVDKYLKKYKLFLKLNVCATLIYDL